MMREPGARLLLGNYEPLLQLATGGMATLYVARQTGAAGFERLMVVKRVHPHLLADREFYDMFRDEARVAAMIHHPNVVPVTDVIEADGELFLVMEYIESAALSSLMSAVVEVEQRLTPAIVSRILVDALSGLHAAHEAVDMRGRRLELVHRDVSPQNLIVGIDGTSRLIDFGVAKARHRLTETRSGSLKGKLGYMSPEQAHAHDVDRRADVFAAGVVLWEALVARRLFRGETEVETIRRIVEAPVEAPSVIVPSLPRALDAVVMKALDRDREKRFQTAAELVEALEAACPPATARDVAAVVKAYCGERIEARRAKLEAMLDGRVEALSSSRIPVGGADLSRTVDASPSARRKAAAMVREAAPPEGTGTDGRIASTHDAQAPHYPTQIKARLLIAATVAAAIVAIAGILIGSRRSPPHPAIASASASAQSPGVPSALALAADEVALELSADAPFQSVHAPGMRAAQMRDTHASLVVARWGGELAIDGMLQDGRAVHAVAQSDGPRSVVLQPEAVPEPDVPAPSASTRPLKTPGKVPPTPPPGPNSPTPASELHQNPYGP